MKNLKGAVAVITGAGSGIGRGLAQELASHGAQLALADVNAAGLKETRNLLGPAAVRTYTVDVSDRAAVEAFAGKVEQDFGRVSLLINNAGVALCGTFEQLTVKDFEWLFSINFWGVVYGCKFFIPLLKREPEAHIVNISSVFGLIAPPGQTAYAASKFAVRGFTEALKGELMNSKVAVTCVHPGGIRTRIAENARAAAATPVEDQMHARERFNQLARTPPEKAAKVIVTGILRNKGRVLIGADAYRIDVFQRLVPASSAFLMAKYMGIEAPKSEPVAAPQTKERGEANANRT